CAIGDVGDKSESCLVIKGYVACIDEPGNLSGHFAGLSVDNNNSIGARQVEALGGGFKQHGTPSGGTAQMPLLLNVQGWLRFGVRRVDRKQELRDNCTDK